MFIQQTCLWLCGPRIGWKGDPLNAWREAATVMGLEAEEPTS